MYVTDSLFYLQHLIGGNEEDENRMMFGSRYRELINCSNEQEIPQESAEDIKNRMIEKSLKLSSGERQ
jgi:hypothetical protein